MVNEAITYRRIRIPRGLNFYISTPDLASVAQARRHANWIAPELTDRLTAPQPSRKPVLSNREGTMPKI